ncbi:MAG TPA: CocE/NonD family hydrolase [Casimicrobiaceae bacterium]|nr:CocE/NonD family hydrolase [Casimicrobiaceae bacterium]
MTPRTTERVLIDGPAGPLEVVLNTPEQPPVGLALIAHPHPLQGGTLDNKVVTTLAKTFFNLRYVAVRFNFRGVNQSAGMFDEGVGETDDAASVLAYARERFGESLPFALAGFSFGSFVMTRLAKRVSAERLVLVAPAVQRFAVETVPEDTIVIHGEQDDVVHLADVFDWARPQHLPIIVFPGTGHFFHGRLQPLARIVTALWHHRASSSDGNS